MLEPATQARHQTCRRRRASLVVPPTSFTSFTSTKSPTLSIVFNTRIFVSLANIPILAPPVSFAFSIFTLTCVTLPTTSSLNVNLEEQKSKSKNGEAISVNFLGWSQIWKTVGLLHPYKVHISCDYTCFCFLTLGHLSQRTVHGKDLLLPFHKQRLQLDLESHITACFYFWLRGGELFSDWPECRDSLNSTDMTALSHPSNIFISKPKSVFWIIYIYTTVDNRKQEEYTQVQSFSCLSFSTISRLSFFHQSQLTPLQTDQFGF